MYSVDCTRAALVAVALGASSWTACATGSAIADDTGARAPVGDAAPFEGDAPSAQGEPDASDEDARHTRDASGAGGVGGASGSGGAGGSGGSGGSGGDVLDASYELRFEASFDASVDGPDDASPSDAPVEDADATPTREAGACDPSALKVNEVQAKAHGLARDEFVEIYNPNASCAVSLSGWSLKYSAATGNSPLVYWTASAGDDVPAGGFFVVAGPDFRGVANGALSSGLSDGGGAVGLFHGSTRIDAVAYVTATATNPLVEGAPAPRIPDDAAIARSPDGADTDDNARDFVVLGTPTPGAPNR